VGKASGNGKCCKGLKMTNFQSKHVALLKNTKDCADVHCVTLTESGSLTASWYSLTYISRDITLDQSFNFVNYN